MKKSKINGALVIGGTGFVGEYLVDLLSKKRGISVEVLYYNSVPSNKSPSIDYRRLDLRAPIKVSLKKSGLGDFDVAIAMTQPDLKIAKNIIKIFESAKNLKKIIFVSTMLVYPDSKIKISESMRPVASSPYEKGKIIEEGLFRKYAELRKIELSIIRLANIYGNVKNRGIVGHIFRSIIDKRPLTIRGDGQHKRDYVFVEDAVKFIKFLVFFNHKKRIEVFNICTGQGYTIQDLIKLAREVTKGEIDIKYSEQIKEKRCVIGDNRKILNVSGIKLSYGIMKGLKKTYLNYLNNE